MIVSLQSRQQLVEFGILPTVPATIQRKKGEFSRRRKKIERKRKSCRKRKTVQQEISSSTLFLKYFDSETQSHLKTIYLHCIVLNPKWTESCQNQPSSIILPFKCLLSPIVIALKAKILFLPANSIAGNQKFCFRFENSWTAT